MTGLVHPLLILLSGALLEPEVAPPLPDPVTIVASTPYSTCGIDQTALEANRE